MADALFRIERRTNWEDEVVTYVARDLEPHRGFPALMRALPALLAARPRAEVVICGGDGVSYGRPPSEGGSWREALLAELGKAEEQKAEVTERLARMDLPSLELPDNLDRLYADLVRDLEATLANPDLILRAIDVMKDLIDEIVVEERPEGGHTLDVKGNLARMLRASAPSHDWQGFDLSKSSLGMVAGVGFEPTTFRL